jgi:hypothetical protein
MGVDMVHKSYLEGWVVLALAFLFLVACTPTAETATVPAEQPTEPTPPAIETMADQSTPSPAAVPETTTSIATSVSTPTPTPISPEDIQATHTAIQATGEAEIATLFAPTATFTPSPTFTPVPGPVWPIFFSGVPCQDTYRCEDILFQSQDSRGYLINSDGSQLTPITDLGFPADLNHPVFSANGTQLAYLANFEPEGVWHLFLAKADGTEAVDLGAGAFFDYQFIAAAGCLIGIRFIERTLEGMKFSIEKRCVDQLQPQELEIVTFPVFYELHFSPQGDTLLAYGETSNHEAQLLVHQIEGDTQLIYSSADEDGNSTGAARWLPDGEKIEFVSTKYFQPGDTVTTTFNLIGPDGSDLEVRLNLVADVDMSNGTWSPDGQEFAFTYADAPGAESGVYVLNLNTGEWRQVLSHFYLGGSPIISAWEQGTDESSE